MFLWTGNAAINDSDAFQEMLTRPERRLLAKLTSPASIQAFLDELAYNHEDTYRCPFRVLRDRKAHCYDGAVFAAALLGHLGHPPLVVNLFPKTRNDDEHLLAVYRRRGAWGAVAKSNFVGLRFREPIHRTLRELVISYFEHYYNLAREKTLRSYTRPLNLTSFDRDEWLTRDETMDRIADRLSAMRRIPLLARSMIAGLSPVDERSYRAGLCGADLAGLYVPEGLVADGRQFFGCKTRRKRVVGQFESSPLRAAGVRGLRQQVHHLLDRPLVVGDPYISMT